MKHYSLSNKHLSEPLLQEILRIGDFYVLTLFIIEKSRSQFTDDTGKIMAMLRRRLRQG